MVTVWCQREVGKRQDGAQCAGLFCRGAGPYFECGLLPGGSVESDDGFGKWIRVARAACQTPNSQQMVRSPGAWELLRTYVRIRGVRTMC